MKKVSLMIVFILSVLLSPYTIARSITPCEGVPIDLGSGGSGNEGEGDDPNGVTVVPITCQLSDFADELEFGFLADLGNVTITLINISAGTTQTGMLNSQLGIVYFPITLGSGQYYMTLVTQTGKLYHAQFTV